MKLFCNNFFVALNAENIRILVISDIHNQQDKLELPKADLLVVAGDFTDTGSYKELENFFDFLFKNKHKFEKIVVVPGNHELTLDKEFYLKYGERYYHKENPLDPDIAKSIVERQEHFEFVCDSEFEFKGLKFWGTPWIPAIGRWAYTIPNKEFAEKKFSEIPEDTDVLISHAPPHGVLDQITSIGRERDSETGEIKVIYETESTGSKELLRRVAEVEPRLHLFGHVHESHGWVLHKNTLFVNASIMDKSHQPNNLPTLIQFYY